MAERLALVVSSTEDLKRKFDEILKGGDRPKDSYRNSIRNRETKSQATDGTGGETVVHALIEQKELAKLAELWVSGAKIDWRLLYNSHVPKRTSFPTYPFPMD